MFKEQVCFLPASIFGAKFCCPQSWWEGGARIALLQFLFHWKIGRKRTSLRFE